VVDIGVVSTPGVALMTRQLKADGGVVITASHNPIQYNGMKFLQPIGTGLTAAMAEQLRAIWADGAFALADAEHQGVESSDDSTHQRHVDAICRNADVDAIAARHFKVALDSVNGAGCAVTPMLMQRLGVELVHLNAEPTGRFAHPPEPVVENLAQLGADIVAHKADVGFAQDADADRLAIIDETGRYIGEEYTLALAAAFVLGKRKGPVATNLVTSRMIDDVAAAAGCEVIRTPTGEANVVEAMLQNGCILGGEGGGGVIDPQVVPVRNSLVGIACVLQYMAETNKTVSQLVAEIPHYEMIKAKMPCPAGAAEKVASAMRDAFAGRAGAAFNDTDGFRVDLPEGWVCARASNTEPIMRIIAEAARADDAEALVAQVRKIAEPIVGQA